MFENFFKILRIIAETCARRLSLRTGLCYFFKTFSG
jgi:hypothetical protein